VGKQRCTRTGVERSVRSESATSTTVQPATLSVAFDELLRQGVLVPAFQPIIDLATGSVVACEALARDRRRNPGPDL